MSEELKPCPFCGSEILKNTGRAIYCDFCGVYAQFDDHQRPYETPEVQVRGWNSRNDKQECFNCKHFYKEPEGSTRNSYNNYCSIKKPNLKKVACNYNCIDWEKK